MTTMTKQEIHLWLDRTSGGTPLWILSREDDAGSVTLQTYGTEWFGTAYSAAIKQAVKEGLEAWLIGQHGERSRITTG
jgi:hypothetical protein